VRLPIPPLSPLLSVVGVHYFWCKQIEGVFEGTEMQLFDFCGSARQDRFSHFRCSLQRLPYRSSLYRHSGRSDMPPRIHPIAQAPTIDRSAALSFRELPTTAGDENGVSIERANLQLICTRTLTLPGACAAA
jgi:hypothetical protein